MSVIINQLDREEVRQPTQVTSSSISAFKSVGFQLKLIVVLTVMSFLFLGYKGISGMRDAGESIGQLHAKGMQLSINAGQSLTELATARSELLLAFQHDPTSQFSEMHNHPLSLHIQQATAAIGNLQNIVKTKILSADLSPDELKQANELNRQLERVISNGFNPTIAALQGHQYEQANQILLTEINPLFNIITTEAQAFLDLQVAEGESTFAEFNSDMRTYIILVALFSSISMLLITVSLTLIRKRALPSRGPKTRPLPRSA